MLKNPKSQRGRYWKLPVVAAITLFVTAVNAQQVIRIGFIDPVRLIEQAPQGGRALKQLEIEFQPSNENLMKQHNRIQEMEAELDKNILVISASDAQVRQRTIQFLLMNVRGGWLRGRIVKTTRHVHVVGIIATKVLTRWRIRMMRVWKRTLQEERRVAFTGHMLAQIRLGLVSDIR
mgnify:CR=1 FL=1